MKVHELCRASVTDDQALFSSDLLDSLGRVELAFFLNDLTGFAIEPQEITRDNFGSITQIFSFLSRKGRKDQ